MAGAAFREQDGFEPGDGDVVSRLLTQSARARSQGIARPARPVDDPVADYEPDMATLLGTARLEDEVARLDAELQVVRAALKAEQRESAALRAELERVTAYAVPVGDVRSDRDRWATLVERLLFVQR